MALPDYCLPIGRLRRVIAGAGLLSLALTGFAAADGLFVPLADAQISASAAVVTTPDLGVIRSRDVALDPAYLSANIAPAGMDSAADRLQQAPAASSVRIELFPGYVVDLNRRTLTEATGGGFVWTGDSPNKTNGDADLVIRNGLVTGIVTYGGHNYRVDPLGVGLAHRISELDSNKFPGDIELPVITPGAGPSPKPDTTQAAPTEITLLIPYTTRAKNEVADVVAQANLAVSRSNSAFVRSNVDISFRLLGTMEVANFDEMAAGNTYNSVLNDITNDTGTGPFQPVRTMRNTLGADLVGLLFTRTENCGLGWLPPEPSAQTANLGYQVTTLSCVPNGTFAHESGHNMGLNHDRFVVNPAPPNTEYNFGYVSIPGAFRDTMAYFDQCAAANVLCVQINNFSNPNVTYNGIPTGIPAGQPGAADAARRLNETRAGVAAYRDTVVAPPPIIVAAVTPVSRATSVGGTVTAFATVINGGTTPATSCSVALPGTATGVNFNYKTRDFNTNALGPDNTAVDIPGNNARQDFLLEFNPTVAISANIPLVFTCTNTAPATSVVGLNTFLLTAANPAPADLISIAVTATNDGIANVPLNGTGFAALAGNNIGAAATLTATVSAAPVGGNATLPAVLTLCQSNNTGCLAPAAPSVTFNAASNTIVTFTAFIASNGTAIPFDPANTRLFVHFTQGATQVGSASVAVRTVAPDQSLALAK